MMSASWWRIALNRHKSLASAAIGGLAILLPLLSDPPPASTHVVILVMAAVAWTVLLPAYAKATIFLEDVINLKLGLVTPARLTRLAVATPIVLLAQILAYQTVSKSIIPTNGEIEFGTIEVLLCMASAGLHSAATIAAYHGIADRTRNVILAFSLNIWVALLAIASPYGWSIALAAATLFILHILVGTLSDLRSRIYPRQGIGMFFGTFNPVHKTHIRILENALSNRRLDKIYLHATTIPKLHRQALDNGELALTVEAGMRIYHRTERADPAKNYFPTGNRFYEYALRRELLQASIRDAGLHNQIEVLNEPDIYEADGFFGLIREIKKRHPGASLHGLHGSDPGGIWVRNIFDHSGWIYPCTAVRRDKISATAIRDGATGMTSPTVERFLEAARHGRDFEFSTGYTFNNQPENRPPPQKTYSPTKHEPI